MSVVVDEDPLSPSLRIETTGQHDAARAQEIALARSTSIAKLRKTLDGDLDAIVTECLQKDPADRYVTVQGIIDDVTAYREQRPINARAPDIWYRTGRFVQRHRGSVLSGALTTLVLLMAVVAVGLSWRSTIDAQHRALEEAAAAQQVGEFFADMLEQANPDVAGGEELTVRELLDQSVNGLAALENRPRVRARLLEVMTNAYLAMALPKRAEGLALEALLLRETLGDPAAEIDPLASLAIAKLQQGDLDEALLFGQRAVAAATDSDSAPVARATAHQALAIVLAQRGSYAQEREQLQAAMAQLKGVETDKSRHMRASYLMGLGSNSKQQGNYAAALQEFESVLEILEDTPAQRSTRMFTLRELGTLHSNLGNEALAVNMLGESLELARDVFGNENAHILGSLVRLGRSLGNLNRNDDAEPLFLEALRLAEKTIGKDHGNYARILHDYAEVLRQQGDFVRLRDVRDEAVLIADAFFGREHSTSVNLRKARAMIELDEGRYPQALDALRGVLPDVYDAFGENHMITFNTEAVLAQALLETGNFDAARESMSQLANIGAQIADGSFYAFQRNLIQMSRLYRLTGSLDKALEYAELAVATRRKMDGGRDWTMLEPLVARIHVLTLVGDDRVAADVEQALSLIANNPDRLTLQMHIFLTDFATSLARGEHAADADRFCQASVTAMQGALSTDHPLLSYAMINCAAVALDRGSPIAATKLLQRAVPAVIQTLGRTNWRAQWALAIEAIANNQREERDAALDGLRKTLGDSSPLVRHLSELGFDSR
jgi:tetratricopeptide (TPR) repeat protein